VPGPHASSSQLLAAEDPATISDERREQLEFRGGRVDDGAVATQLAPRRIDLQVTDGTSWSSRSAPAVHAFA
jgi:hypothetical protein